MSEVRGGRTGDRVEETNMEEARDMKYREGTQ
jgi:hypothetical protein